MVFNEGAPGSPTRPRVLLVNDDGLEAQGLALLEEQVREFTDDVWVVAPQHENSGGGHSVSLDRPVRVRQMGERRFAVAGTPTDCVLMAYWELMTDAPPTIVLSGINHGENLGEDMTYSGTMGAAMEAAVLGIPAVALSQKRTLGQPPDFTAAKTAGPGLLRSLLTFDWAPAMVVNVNFPINLVDMGRPRLTRLGQRHLGTFKPIAGIDGRNIPFYWIKISHNPGEQPPDTDLAAASAGHVAVTALSMDLTSPELNARLEAQFTREQG